MTENLLVTVRQRPVAAPAESDFVLQSGPLPEPGENQLLIRTEYLSLDPYMGSALKGRHMSGAIGPGEIMPGETIGRVVKSRDPGFAEGDWVLSRGGWQAYSVADARGTGRGMATALSAAATRLDPDPRVPVSAYLGVMGMPGLTAFAGTADVLDPGPGETFVVSAATGAVGATAGQVARIMGARVVGIAGSDAKCAYAVSTLGFDACLNHRGPGFEAALAAACPDGIDAYFDTVGGPLQSIVFSRLAMRGRVMLCGMMQQYNAADILPGPSLSPILARRACITGFVVYDHWEKLPRWRRLAADWITGGRLAFKEDLSQGLDAAPAAFARLMAGQNFGKTIVTLSSP